MSTHASALARRTPADVRSGLVVAGVAIWTLVVLAAELGAITIPKPSGVAVLLPAALVGIGLAGLVEPTDTERRATIWAVVLGGGIAGAEIILRNSEWALAVPAIAASAVLAARRPTVVVTALFVMAGAYNTILALTPIQVYKVVDVALAGLACGVAWTLIVRRTDHRPVLLWPGVAALIAYALITAFQVPLADSLEIGRDSFHASTWYLLAAPLVALAPWSPATHGRMVRAVLVVALIVSAYAVFRWIDGPATQETNEVLATRAAFNFVDGKLVLFGSFPTGHHLAAWMAGVIPFCFAVGLGARQPRWQLIAALACGLGTAALVGSKVRAGFVGLALGVLVVVLVAILSRGFAPIRGRAVAIGAIGLVAVVITFAALASGPEGTRYANILNPTADEPFKERTYKWRDALSDIDDHPWGQGLGTAGITQVEFGRFVSLGKTDVDNSYLKIALDQGIALAGLYVLALLLLLVGLVRRALQCASSEGAAVAAGAAGSLVGFVAVIFTGVYIEGLTALATWIVIGLGVARFSHAS